MAFGGGWGFVEVLPDQVCYRSSQVTKYPELMALIQVEGTGPKAAPWKYCNMFLCLLIL